MRVFEDVLERLTPTERRVVLYFASNGGSAREIAGALGVSERTVYKALYRYRRIAASLGHDASDFYFRRRTGGVPATPSPRYSNDCNEEVVRLLRLILAELEKINAKLGGAPRAPGREARVETRVEEEPVEGGEGLPSFANGNPWLRVLSGRR